MYSSRVQYVLVSASSSVDAAGCILYETPGGGKVIEPVVVFDKIKLFVLTYPHLPSSKFLL
jgi:hypothetical protein